MRRSKSNQGRLTELQVKFRGLAIEDGARDMAQALAEDAGLATKPPSRPRKSSAQYPFETALRQQLVEIEARLGALVDRLPDALVVSTGSGTILLANARCEALFGHASEALVGQSISTILSGSFVTQVIASGASPAVDAIGESRRAGIELVGQRKDGSTFAAEALAQTLEGGDQPLLILSLRDASVRHAREKRLVEDRDRLSALLSAGPDALLEINRHGRVLYANHRCERIFGHHPGEIVGQPLSRILPDFKVAQVGGSDDAHGAGWHQAGIHQDGSSLDLIVRAGAARGDSGGNCLLSIQVAQARDYAGRSSAAAFDSAPDAMVVVDRLGLVQLFNHQAELRFGYKASEVIGKPVTMVLPDGFVDRLNAGERSLTEAELARETGAAITITGRSKAGENLLLEMQLAPSDESFIATFRLAGAHTSRRAAIDVPPPLDASFAEVALGSIGEALVCADLSGNISFMNDAAERLTGWSWDAARNQPLEDVVRMFDPATQLTPRMPAGNVAQTAAGQLPAGVAMVRRDGRTVPIEGSVAPIEGREGSSIGRVLLFRDASQSQAHAQQIAHSAQHDPLTGLPNRVLLNDRIKTAISIAPRHQKKVGVLFLDLDGFKRVNDTLGHAVGDKLLQVVAERLMTCIRGSDTVSRIGGDEFVVLLSEVERAEDSAITARRMLEAISETIRSTGTT